MPYMALPQGGITPKERADRIAGAVLYYRPGDSQRASMLRLSKGGIQTDVPAVAGVTFGPDLSTDAGEAQFINDMQFLTGRGGFELSYWIDNLADLASVIRTNGAASFSLENVDALFTHNHRHPAEWVTQLSAPQINGVVDWPADLGMTQELSPDQLRARNQGRIFTFTYHKHYIPPGAEAGATTAHFVAAIVDQGGFQAPIGYPNKDPFVTITNDGTSWLQIGPSHMASEVFVLPVTNTLGFRLGNNTVAQYVLEETVPRIMSLEPNQALRLNAQALTERELGAEVAQDAIIQTMTLGASPPFGP